jgi:hypothetical protein
MDVRRSSHSSREKELLSLLILEYIVAKTSKKSKTQIKKFKFSLVISKKRFRMRIYHIQKLLKYLYVSLQAFSTIRNGINMEEILSLGVVWVVALLLYISTQNNNFYTCKHL